MADPAAKGLYHAAFTYTDEVLSDFEAMYLKKKEITPVTRIVLGAVGLTGVVYFGLQLYRGGLQLAYVGYLLICSILLLLALHRSSRRPDDTTKKYRKYYQDKGATFTVNDGGVELHIEGQQKYARSKYKEIYGLFETDLCFYFAIKGRAYYILPKASIEGGTPDEFRAYMQKKCLKRFLKYELN